MDFYENSAYAIHTCQWNHLQIAIILWRNFLEIFYFTKTKWSHLMLTLNIFHPQVEYPTLFVRVVPGDIQSRMTPIPTRLMPMWLSKSSKATSALCGRNHHSVPCQLLTRCYRGCAHGHGEAAHAPSWCRRACARAWIGKLHLCRFTGGQQKSER